MLLTGARVAAVGGVFVLGAFTWGYASEGAAAVSSFVSEDPIQDVKDLHKVQTTFNDMIRYGDKSYSKQDGQIVTELVHDSYDNIKEGVTEELLGVLKEMMKKDKKLDGEWKQAYHSLINQRYAQLTKKQQALPQAQPSNSPAAPTQDMVEPAVIDDQKIMN